MKTISLSLQLLYNGSPWAKSVKPVEVYNTLLQNIFEVSFNCNEFATQTNVEIKYPKWNI